MAPWRLIIDGPCSPGYNMTLDRAMQIARDEGRVPATLRLYEWARPTASLGRFQDATAINANAGCGGGIDVVRRFTGGRGVLHDDEVTYCVVASTQDGVPRGIAASYRYLSGPLAAAFRALGVRADVATRQGGMKGSAACYLYSTSADLSLSGRKVSGSAQVWLRDTVMQHGSFVLTRDVDCEARVFALGAEGAEELAAATITLGDVLSPPPARETVRAAVVAGFEEVLGVTFERGEVTGRELEIAASLVEQVTLNA